MLSVPLKQVMVLVLVESPLFVVLVLMDICPGDMHSAGMIIDWYESLFDIFALYVLPV